MATLPTERSFRPGETAPVSGTYRVVHLGHRGDHRVLIIRGDEFPGCRRCQQAVRFELVEGIDYAAHDWDLAGPNLQLVK